MKSRHLLVPPLLLAVALFSGCNDTNEPQTTPVVTPPTTTPPVVVPPRSMTISEFVASLMAMVMGTACETAPPASLDSVTLTDDMNAVDANTLSENCAG